MYRYFCNNSRHSKVNPTSQITNGTVLDRQLHQQFNLEWSRKHKLEWSTYNRAIDKARKNLSKTIVLPYCIYHKDSVNYFAGDSIFHFFFFKLFLLYFFFFFKLL